MSAAANILHSFTGLIYGSASQCTHSQSYFKVMKKGPVVANQSLGRASACHIPLLGIPPYLISSDVNIYSQTLVLHSVPGLTHTYKRLESVRRQNDFSAGCNNVPGSWIAEISRLTSRRSTFRSSNLIIIIFTSSIYDRTNQWALRRTRQSYSRTNTGGCSTATEEIWCLLWQTQRWPDPLPIHFLKGLTKCTCEINPMDFHWIGFQHSIWGSGSK